MHLPLLKGYFYASKQFILRSRRVLLIYPLAVDSVCKTGGEKKLNPRSEADAQVTTNRLASLRNRDVRSECFIAAHANPSPDNTILRALLNSLTAPRGR